MALGGHRVDGPPSPRTRLRWCRRAVLGLLRVEVRYGAVLDHLDRREGRPVVVVCNHASLLDGPILALASPHRMTFPVTPKHSVHHPVTSRGLRLMERLGLGCVEVMNADRPWALRSLARTLRGGGVVAVFPQGRIVGAEERVSVRPGAEWLCRRTGATVVRARIDGAARSRLFARSGSELRPRITVEF